MFDVAFGDLSEDAYATWFSTSSYQRVTVTIEGEQAPSRKRAPGKRVVEVLPR